jgi:hypothetical protein
MSSKNNNASIKERKNQLTTASGYDVNRMVFSDPVGGSVPDTPIVFRRINISTKNKDGTIGDLILPTERVFSFGTSENTNPETKKVNGYVLPLCLWSRNGPSEAEKAWTTTFDNIVEHCKQYLLDNKEELELYDLEPTDLKKFNPLYYKKEKGKIVDGTGPTLYAKLIASKKHDKIMSMFFNSDGESIDPLSLLKKYCYVKGAIKIESIFLGNKVSLQVKLYEADVELLDAGMKPLLPKRVKGSDRLMTGTQDPMNVFDDDLPDDIAPPIKKAKDVAESRAQESKERTGSLANSDVEEEDEPKKPVVPPKVVKKVVKKKV